MPTWADTVLRSAAGAILTLAMRGYSRFVTFAPDAAFRHFAKGGVGRYADIRVGADGDLHAEFLHAQDAPPRLSSR
jgi:hypothetical protein